MTSYPQQRDPRVKIEWADRHLKYLTKRISRFVNRGHDIIDEPDAQTGETVPHVYFKRALDSDIPCLIGDILHNIRGALDHLVFRLMPPPADRRDLKRRAFPIGHNSDDYKTAKGRCVAALRTDLVQRIDLLEPYQGGKGHAIWQLHELNIIDKHRLLLTVGRAQHHVWKTHAFSPINMIHGFPMRRSRFIPLQDHAPLPAPSPLSENNERQQPTITLAFDEPAIIKPQAVIPTLQGFLAEVESTIAIFDDIP